MAKGVSVSEAEEPSESLALRLLLLLAFLMASLPVCLAALPFPVRFFGGILQKCLTGSGLP